MSKLTFLHDVKTKSITTDGKKVIHEEEVVHGEKGLIVKYYHKEDSNIEKIVIVKKDDGYLVKTTENDKKDEKTMSKVDMLKFITKNKKLAFAVDYLKSLPSRLTSLKRASKKSSRKSTKKSSTKKRSAKRASKKSSKKAAPKIRKRKRASKKGGSRKVSKRSMH